MKNRVLIVDDEMLLREVIKDYFEDDGYICDEADNGIAALEAIEYNDYQLILLDVMLPEMDGFSVCRTIRKKSDVPIIMLTARADESDQLAGYDYGADEYVTKPFSPKLLLAKANALLNRAQGFVCNKDGLVSGEGIEINRSSHTVTVDSEPVELTPKEYDLLLFLMSNKGRVMSRDTLLTKIWGYDYFGDLRTVDTHIKKLRSKLGSRAWCIKTVIKAGYKYDDTQQEE